MRKCLSFPIVDEYGFVICFLDDLFSVYLTPMVVEKVLCFFSTLILPLTFVLAISREGQDDTHSSM
jgi:hypothetical protein